MENENDIQVDNDEVLVKCTDCASECNFDDMTEVASGDMVCEACLANEYAYVESTEEWHHISRVGYCNDDQCNILEEDQVTCNHCGDTYHHENTAGVNCGGDIETVCNGCIENSGEYAVPGDAYDYYHIDCLHYDELDGEYYVEPRNTSLRCYSTNVFDVVGKKVLYKGSEYNKAANRLVFGVELETDTRDYASANDIAEQVLANTDFSEIGICKDDGSVDGPELVTVPGDLHAHDSTIDWDAYTEELRPIARGHHASGVGMHVHINKGAMSMLTLGKMLVFANASNNSHLLSVIAQRDITATSWCKTDPYKYPTVGKAGDSAIKRDGGKYSILNVTRWTVECRMFQSNLQPERIRKNIEFCHALVTWCAQTSVKDVSSFQADILFRNFVQAERKTYPNLSKFLRDRLQDITSQQLNLEVA